MLLGFFDTLRRRRVPVSLREFLDLLGALRAQVVFADMEDFYRLSRACLVKDERWLDRYDQAFEEFFRGVNRPDDALQKMIPEAWLESGFLRDLSEEERQAIEEMGGLEKLLEEFQKRLEEQQERHEGGDRWIGAGGTSPFGNSGWHPAGIRAGGEGRARRAVKVWQQRQYRNLDGNRELGTRNIKMALRRLRRFARSGAAEELDLPGTIRSTAHNGGLLDLQMMPERRNAVKVLLFLDVGGSMDPHVRICEELFSAARTEFKYLEHFYFHNFIYESVWRDNRMRYNEHFPLEEILRSYGRDYRAVFVGDAAMSPYEIVQVGGGVEHWNAEPGKYSLQRINEHYDRTVWLNPLPRRDWDSVRSVGMVRELMEDRMYPLTLSGLERAIAALSH